MVGRKAVLQTTGEGNFRGQAVVNDQGFRPGCTTDRRNETLVLGGGAHNETAAREVQDDIFGPLAGYRHPLALEGPVPDRPGPDVFRQ